MFCGVKINTIFATYLKQIIMDKYKNDPTNEFETVKSYTNEELFYNQEDINDITMNYVNDLEKKVRELKRQLKELL